MSRPSISPCKVLSSDSMLIAKFAIFSHQLFAEQSRFFCRNKSRHGGATVWGIGGLVSPHDLRVHNHNNILVLKRFYFKLNKKISLSPYLNAPLLGANTTISFHLNFPNFLLHRCPNYFGQYNILSKITRAFPVIPMI